MQTESHGLDSQDEIERLTSQHRTLKVRLKELDRRLSLTSAERVERAQIKKMKLLTKDRILRLQQSSQPALSA